MELEGRSERAGVAVMADLARAGPPEQKPAQECLSRRAGVAVMADLARAGPPGQKAPRAGPSRAELMGSSRGSLAAVEAGGEVEEDEELPPAQPPNDDRGPASEGALRKGGRGVNPIDPEAPQGGSSDTDMDLDMVKTARLARKNKKRKKT